MTGKKIVQRIQQSLSLGSRSPSPQPQASCPSEGPAASSSVGDTSLAKFLEKELNEDYHKLVATSFAEFIKGDTGKRNIDFDDHLHFLGYNTKQKAVELLQKKFPNVLPKKMEEVEGEHIFTRSVKNRKGRKKTSYVLTFDEFEELLLNAQTAEGEMARKAVLAIKNAIFKFIKIEKSRDLQQLQTQKAQTQQQLEEQMTRLAIEEGKRREAEQKGAALEAVQVKLQATIESQRKRDEKKEARKKQQKEPLETAYIMTNMPDDNQGPYKCGKTGGDAKKRAKDMQTGNHEEMRVVASAKCVDSKLIEDVMHRIFRDYRTNDKLEWFDTNLKSMASVLQFVVRVIDGLNCVDHDEVCIQDALQDVMAFMEERILACEKSHHAYIEAETIEVESCASRNQIDGPNPVDEWLVSRIKSRTLPQKVLSHQIAENIGQDYSPNLVTRQMGSYANGGVRIPRDKIAIKSGEFKGRGRGFIFDVDQLRQTLISKGFMEGADLY